MTYVITQPCCNEGSCTEVCPVNCISPRPGDEDFGKTEMLYIDPASCIDCGACVDACPVDAIQADYDLTPETEPYLEINAAYFADSPAPGPAPADEPAPSRPATVATDGPWRVAIVGSGPSACYAALSAIDMLGDSVELSIFERLPTPFGLLRYGVAPDHQDTKLIAKKFTKLASRKNVRFYLNVEIGEHLSHSELLEHHHAVIYATGTPVDRALGIPGEVLAGSHSAAEFVSWYNGHPDFADRRFDFSGERAVVIGNGNVALDVARILTADIDHLRRGDIAEHALEQLASSNVKEVVVVGRRGPAQAAYTHSELLGLSQTPGVTVTADESDLSAALAIAERHDAPATAIAKLKAALPADLAARGAKADTSARTVNLRYLLSPLEMVGDDAVSGVRFARNDVQLDDDGNAVAAPTGEFVDLSCGLVLRAVGFRGVDSPGLPSDPASGTIPNSRGRVHDPDDGSTIPGLYAVGWIKRGPSGVIGSNRYCSQQTVEALVTDLESGSLPGARPDRTALESLLDSRNGQWFGFDGWKAIDKFERAQGRATGRTRVKVSAIENLLDVAFPRTVA